MLHEEPLGPPLTRTREQVHEGPEATTGLQLVPHEAKVVVFSPVGVKPAGGEGEGKKRGWGA